VSCLEFEERIALYVEGDLDAAEAGQVAAHLSGCAGCRDLAEELRRMEALLKELGAEAVPTAAYDQVRRRVRGRIERGRAWRWSTAVAAALVLALGLAALVSMRQPGRVAPAPMAARVEQPPIMPPAVPSPPAVKPARRLRSTPVRPAPPQAEQLVIKILTDDPDVVIIWLVGGNGESQ